MRPLLLNATDIRGGAARAAYRLHLGLRGIGVDSRMLVQSKESDDQHVLGPRSRLEELVGIVRPQFDLLPLYCYPKRKKEVFYPGWLPDRVARKVDRSGADLVHLHWISRGFIGLQTVARFRRPVVWTLHDMWAFTGGCHYDAGCGQYMQGCGRCPSLGSNRNADLSRWAWRKKKGGWKGLNLRVVTPSRWLADCARNSPILGGCSITAIPNGIDLTVYRPHAKDHARSILSLPNDKRLIMFGAVSGAEEERKGFRYLQEALARFAAGGRGSEYTLVVAGASRPSESPHLGVDTIYLGRLHDDVALALAYSAADVFIAPSTQDNLPNTVVEALACGLPCVAFDIGGMPDMIEHERNGYLARPFLAESLAQGIAWVLEDSSRQRLLSERARSKAEEEFDVSRVAKRYLQVYEDAVGSACHA